MTTLWHHHLRYFICCCTNRAWRRATAPWCLWCFPSVELKALHRHFLSKPHISLRYCQTGDTFHSLIMWNTLVNIDVPFRKLLQSVLCSSHDFSQGVNQWCDVKHLALPHVRGEDRCVWQHTVAQEEGGSCGKGRLFFFFYMPSRHFSPQGCFLFLHLIFCFLSNIKKEK